MAIAQADDLKGIVCVFGVRIRVPQEDNEVYFVIRDTGGYLLCSAVRACKHTGNLEPRCFAYVFSCRSCCTEIVLGKHSAISYAEFGDKLFFLIVGDNCYFHNRYRPFLPLVFFII